MLKANRGAALHEAGPKHTSRGDPRLVGSHRGLGAPKGLTPEEHVEWAFRIDHPLDAKAWQPSDQLREAVEFEITVSAEEADEYCA